MNQVYNELLVKQKQSDMLAQQGKHKYEYDSDEDTEVSLKTFEQVRKKSKKFPSGWHMGA